MGTIRGVLLAATLLAPEALSAQGRLVLSGATLLDGTGAPPVAGARIIVDAGRFHCISGPDGCPARAGDQVMDLAGHWIFPGLIDTHVHLPIRAEPEEYRRLQRLRFALGITTVRDAGSLSLEELLAERAGAEDPSRPVPRIVAAARVLPEYEARFNAPRGAPLVNRLAAMGVEAIKVKEPYGGDLWREEVQAARAAGLPSFGHAWRHQPPRGFIREALDAGIDGIVHLLPFALEAQLPEASPAVFDSAGPSWPWLKDRWLSTSPAALDSLIHEMVTRGVWLEPTLTTEYYWGRRVEPPKALSFLGDPRRLREMIRGRRTEPTPVPPAYPGPWARQSTFVGDFVRRGGMVIAGSDSPQAGLDLHEEIRLLGEAAGSPMVGLLAATRNAARALNRSDLGTIEEGKLADALVSDIDPLSAPRATLATRLVLKGGQVYDVDTLRAEFRVAHQARVREAWHGRFRRAGPILGVLFLVGLVVVLLRRRGR